MKRAIIEIDEKKCTGCGMCIPNCPEGALQVIDGKARIISDLFCDGLGACSGHCPEDAIHTVEREAEAYDERRVMANIVRGGANVIAAHLNHLRGHGQAEYLQQALAYLKENGITPPVEAAREHAEQQGCPGARTIDMRARATGGAGATATAAPAPGRLASELRNWPIQLQLINPMAPYFQNADLLVAADCVPFSYADFHRRFLKDKVVVTFCPKLDAAIDQYIEKLALIFSTHAVRSVSVLHMEVPCCGGTQQVVEEALRRAGKTMPVKEYTISIAGEII